MTKRALLLLTLCLSLALTACNIPTAAAVTPTSAPASPTDTSPAQSPMAASPTSNVTSTATAEPATPAPAASNTPSAEIAPVITAENAASLAASPLTLPEYPAQLLWPGQDVTLPAGLSPAPDLLLAYAGAGLYPINLAKPSFGQPVPLPIPGQVLDFAPDLSSVIANPNPGTGQAIIYDLTGKPLHTLDEPAPYNASYSPDGKLLAVTSQSEIAATLYDVASGQRTARLTGFETAAPVYGVGIVPGNRTIYWFARATFVFQDVMTGKMGQKLSYQDFIISTVFSPDGSRLIVSVEGKLFLYSVPDAKQLAEVTLSRPSSSLAISPDGKLLAGAYGPGVEIWDAATLAPVASLPGPNTSTGRVSFSPDGRYLVSEHEENVVEVWRVK